MAFEILRHLQYGSGSDCGQNLNHHPSRILPISYIEDEDVRGYSTIQVIPPRLGSLRIYLHSSMKLPEPSAYFKGGNTFLKSYLYLTDQNFYSNCHLPKKVDDIISTSMKNICKENERKNRGKMKKLIQLLMAQTHRYDTDPKSSPYFSEFYDILLKKEKEEVLIIKSSEVGNYRKTLPAKLPNLTLEPTKKTCYVFLYLPDNTFSPYGRSYVNTSG